MHYINFPECTSKLLICFYNMKSVIILITFLRIVVSNLTEDNLLPQDKKCIEELGINIETILSNINDKIIITEGIPEMNKFMLCSFKNLNGYDENTKTMNFTGLKPAIIKYADLVNGGVVNQEEIAKDAFEYCQKMEGSDAGDQIVKFSNCIMLYVYFKPIYSYC